MLMMPPENPPRQMGTRLAQTQHVILGLLQLSWTRRSLLRHVHHGLQQILDMDCSLLRFSDVPGRRCTSISPSHSAGSGACFPTPRGCVLIFIFLVVLHLKQRALGSNGGNSRDVQPSDGSATARKDHIFD